MRFAAGLVVPLVLLAAALVCSPSQAGAQVPRDTIVPLHGPSVFVPTTPTRVLRAFIPTFGRSVPVLLGAFVPPGTTAVSVNITVVASAPGHAYFETCGLGGVLNCRSSLPLFPGGDSVSIQQTVGIGEPRFFNISGDAGNLVVVDLFGYYVLADANPTAGRFRAVPPTRVLDTRNGGGPLDNQELTVDVSTVLPADAGAAVVTVTVVDAERDGYVTAHPAGTAAPEVSNLLVLRPVRTVSNQVVVGLDNGRFELLQTGRSHLVIDVVGYFTSAATPAGSDGLFVPLIPTELAGGESRGPGSIATTSFTPPVFGPSIGAFALVAVAMPQEVGYVTLWGSGAVPFTTNLFLDAPFSARVGSAIVPVAGGTFSSYLSGPTGLILKAVGFYTA